MDRHRTHGDHAAELSALRRRIEELEAAGGRQATNIRFLDAMERVNTVMQKSRDVDRLLTGVLDEMLSIFGCDRAWLLYPCDPDSPSWRVPMERTRAEWPGAFALGVEVPMDPTAQAVLVDALERDEPVAFGGSSGRPVPADSARAFHIRSQLVMAVYPKTDRPWLLGIHHCARDHNFTEEEQAIFQGLCRRVGDSLGTLLILRDLRESEGRFRTLVEHAPEAIVVLEPTGRFVDANANAARLFRMDLPRLLEIGVLDVSPPRQPDGRSSEEAAREHIERAVSGEEQPFEWTHLDAVGREIICEVRLVRLGAGERPLIRGSVIDITERLAIERQLRELQKMEAVAELAGGVAHDFNNQLVAVLCYADMIAGMQLAPPRAVELARRIVRAAEEAANLTKQLLAFSRRSVLEPRVLDLNDTLKSMATLLRRLVGGRVDLSFDLSAAPALAKVDPHQLEQVLVNLVTNARDALVSGGHIRIGTALCELPDPRRPSLSDLPPGRYAALSVRDDGVGMDAQTRARVFEPFFTTKERGKGTGLGLSTAYGVIRQSGGTIVAESEPGAGSELTVYLPEAVGETPSDVTAGVALGGQGGTEVILLVEDNDTVAEATSRVLAGSGYRVVRARGGDEALERVRAGDPIDLLLTDVMMPGMDGVELSHRVRTMRSGLPVLFTTGYSAKAIERLSSSGQKVHLLQKPFAPRRLLEVVRAVLDEGETRDLDPGA